MNNLDFKAAVQEVKQAADYLRSTGSGRVGAMGMCMGGALTFAAAQHAGLDAAAPFYGIPDPAICQVGVRCFLKRASLRKGLYTPFCRVPEGTGVCAAVAADRCRCCTTLNPGRGRFAGNTHPLPLTPAFPSPNHSQPDAIKIPVQAHFGCVMLGREGAQSTTSAPRGPLPQAVRAVRVPQPPNPPTPPLQQAGLPRWLQRPG
jgi:hypothetical protein